MLSDKEKRTFKIFILIHFVLSALFIHTQWYNVDEHGYFGYLLNWAKGDPYKIEVLADSKTPMLFPAVIFAAMKPLIPQSWYSDDWYFFLKWGRLFLYIYPALLVYISYCWIRRVYGKSYFLIPLLFLLFDPQIFSYGLFVGSDLPSAAILLTVCYTAYRYNETKSSRYWWYFSIAFGIGVALKQTFIFLYILPVIWFLIRAFESKNVNWKRSMAYVLLFALIQLLIINSAYYFTGTFSTLNDYVFRSNGFKILQLQFSENIGRIPIPLPVPFIQGMDLLTYNKEFGGCNGLSTYTNVWFWGKEACKGNIWYYYIGTALFKLPLIIWAAILFLMYRFVRRKHKIALLGKYRFLWIPFLVLLLLLSLYNQFQIGFRHAMPLLALGYVALGYVWVYWYKHYKKLFFTFIVLHIISLALYFPNYAAYTNELIWDKTNISMYMQDASVDYGQADKWADEFVSKHPEYKRPTPKPEAGKFIVSLGRAAMKYPEHPSLDIRWLGRNFKPVGSYRQTLLLYEIKEEDLKKAGLIY